MKNNKRFKAIVCTKTLKKGVAKLNQPALIEF